MEIEDVTVEDLSELIQSVTQDPSYRDKARYFQRVIARTRGLDVAADAIERAFGKDQEKPDASPGKRKEQAKLEKLLARLDRLQPTSSHL